jgi:hypothetical protein
MLLGRGQFIADRVQGRQVDGPVPKGLEIIQSGKGAYLGDRPRGTTR